MRNIFLSLILFSTLSFAFNFDVWSSKITIKEAVKIAKLNNLSLHKESIVSTSKNFDKRFLFLQKYPNNRIFKYHTTLLNKRATVYLYFTKEEKKLYNLKVRWSRQDKKFINAIYTLLDKKYGQKKVLVSNSFGEFIFSKKRQWEEDKNNIIQVKNSLSLTELLYIDTIETNKEKAFKENVKIKKEQTALIKDAHKF